MSLKITLYAENDLIQRVKVYAKSHNTSVSKMVSSFFESILDKEESKKSKRSSRLYGILKDVNMEEDDYKKYLEDKYS